MPAYVIAQLTVTNSEGFENYRQAVEPIVEAHGGRFLVSGGEIASLEGELGKPRMIMIEFPDTAAAERFYKSPEYQAVLPLRLNNSTGTVIVVEGGV